MYKACRTANIAQAIFTIIILFVTIVPPTSAGNETEIEVIGTPARETSEQINDQEETLEDGEAEQPEGTQEAINGDATGKPPEEEVLAPEETQNGSESPERESDTDETKENSTEEAASPEIFNSTDINYTREVRNYSDSNLTQEVNDTLPDSDSNQTVINITNTIPDIERYATNILYPGISGGG